MLYALTTQCKSLNKMNEQPEKPHKDHWIVHPNSGYTESSGVSKLLVEGIKLKINLRNTVLKLRRLPPAY